MRLLVLFILVLAVTVDGRMRMKGGKGEAHSRSKRTIGDIINWKLGILQSLFGGIKGLFGGKGNGGGGGGYGAPPSYQPPRNPRPNHGGGGSKFNLPRIPLKGLFGKGNSGGGSRPTYGAPKPSYGAPKPSYGGGAAPVGPPRPSYGGNNNNNNGGSGYNNGGNGGGSFGPSNAIKMLEAPNLATGRPPAGSGYNGGNQNFGGNQNNYNAPQAAAAGDSYGAPQAAPLDSGDSYGAPQAAPLDSGDSYGAPQADPIDSGDSYGAPQADPIDAGDSYGAPQAAPVSAPNSYGSPQAAPVQAQNSYSSAVQSAPDSYREAKLIPQQQPAQAQDSYGAALAPSIGASASYSTGQSVSQPSAAPAQDSYGVPQSPVLSTSNAASAPDSYGTPTGPVIVEARAPAAVNEADSYGTPESPVIAARAPVASAPDSYGTPESSVLSPDTFQETRSNEADVAIIQSTLQQVQSGSVSSVQDVPVIQSNAAPAVEEEDSYGNPAAQVLPEVVDVRDQFNQDNTVDVYGSALAPVGTSAPVPEEIFTQDSKAPTSFDSYNNIQTSLENAVQDIDLTGTGGELDSYGGNDLNTIRVLDQNVDLPVENFNEAPATPTSAPILFTYAPDARTESAELADPLDILPENYDDSNYAQYDDYDPNDVPADQAEDLSGYGSPAETTTEDLQSYESTAEDLDLRAVQFTTGAADPEITTYSPPIDFKVGTTAPVGIEAADIQYEDEVVSDVLSNGVDSSGEEYIEVVAAPIYDNEYEDEEDTDYEPAGNSIPLQQEEEEEGETADLPNYQPVVLLLGTPEKDTTELPGYGEESEPKEPAKRKAGNYKGAAAKPRYNNWFGRANDWSRKIQRVQGRIRFKNQYFK